MGNIGRKNVRAKGYSGKREDDLDKGLWRGGGGTKGRPKGWKVSGTEEEKERGIGEGREKEE